MICCPFYRSLFDVFWESVGAGKVASLYQGLGTKNLQSVISQFIYFYSYSIFKQWYLAKAKVSKMGTGSNLLVAAAAGTCTAVLTQVLKLTKCFNLKSVCCSYHSSDTQLDHVLLCLGMFGDILFPLSLRSFLGD